MATCAECGKSGFGLLEVKNGKCPACRRNQERQIASEAETKTREKETAKRNALARLVVTSETTVDGISSRVGLVTGQCALGMNIFRDFTAEVRDVVGGRSGAYQRAIKEAKDVCVEEMCFEAIQLGADAVVAVDLDFNEITGGGGLFGGKGMIMVVATGTAIKLS